jgi:hypothetical protein
LQLNVAGRRLAVDLGDHVAGAQPGRGRYRDRIQPEEGVGHPAGGDDLVRDVLGQIDRYGKPSPM